MILTPSDPDITTLIRKIETGRLDLQPNFQRGEVWGKQKKQRLIDSILRSWHIPPIHVIQVPNSEKQEVLDGQQRLVAIRDFMKNEFPIFGYQEPIEKGIELLDGLYWVELPSTIKSKIEDFTIRILTISDYKIGEPGELFYRLNQPTNLTSAEQRNAYFGEARQQVKDIVERIISLGFSTENVGFSNSRMAYDDVIAKCLLTIEIGCLTTKMTSNVITARYRESSGFSLKNIDTFNEVIELLFYAIKKRNTRTRLNKATLFSWLIFYFELKTNFPNCDTEIINYFNLFENIKESSKHDEAYRYIIPKGLTASFVNDALNIYTDRSSSRVSDVSSVLLRDFVLWGLFLSYNTNLNDNDNLNKIRSSFFYLSSQPKGLNDISFQEVIANINWEGMII